MNKVVINDCYGGFDLSKEAINWLKNKGLSEEEIDSLDKCRHHPLLIECVEELGEKANGMFANLVVKEITGRIYKIESYDGKESIKYPFEDTWVII